MSTFSDKFDNHWKCIPYAMATLTSSDGFMILFHLLRRGYTDGDKIHFSNQGVPTVLVSIPLRYMHMPAEVADEKDVEGCIELISQFLIKYK